MPLRDSDIYAVYTPAILSSDPPVTDLFPTAVLVAAVRKAVVGLQRVSIHSVLGRLPNQLVCLSPPPVALGTEP